MLRHCCGSIGILMNEYSFIYQSFFVPVKGKSGPFWKYCQSLSFIEKNIKSRRYRHDPKPTARGPEEANDG